MADPVDQLLDEINAPDTTADPKPETVSKDEFERVTQELERLKSDPIISQLRDNPELLHNLRAQQVQQVPTPAADTADQFWNDPQKAVNEAAERKIRDTVAPMAQQIGANIVGLYIQQFKGTKMSDPFYNVVVPQFDKEIAPLRASLGGYTDEQMQRLFNTIWDAQVGAYVQKRQRERPKDQPVNLGGGAGGGTGPKAKRSLQDIDPGAYKLAVAGGWSQEEMDNYAAELEGAE